MLTLYHNNAEYPIQDTEYYIRELANGLDEVVFTLSIYDPIYAILAEEENIVDRAGQTYKVKQIDAGADRAQVVCQLDLDAWRTSLNVNYNSDTKTVYQQINAVKPNGWTVLDRSYISIGRTIEGDYTPYDICVRCTEVYSVYVRWDNKRKECTIYPKAMGAPIGAFATRELNLKEINYKGKSNDLITRLYAYGKDGMSFASINGGKEYVDNTNYEDRILCGIWRDERYTVKADLLADAQKKLEQLSVPQRTYECSIVDLQATNPELYNNLDFSLFTAATLIDDIKNTSVNYQVVERHIYPYHPDMNEVIFNSEPLKITTSVADIEYQIDSPNSSFQQIQAQKISNATNWLLSGDGYVVAVKGDDGEWKELLFMDTNDIATAQKVIRINENGIGFSRTGANGPYTNAWTIDGQLVADFITTGSMLAERIRGGILSLGGSAAGDYKGGQLIMYNGSNTEIGHWNNSGISVKAGTVTLGSKTSLTDANSGVYIGSDGIALGPSSTFKATNAGAVSASDLSITGGSIKLTKQTLTDASDGLYLGTDGIALGKSSTFKVTNVGGVTTSDISITGGSIKLTKQALTDANNGLYLGTDGIALGANSTFTVTSAGAVTTTNISVTGGSIKLTKQNMTDANDGLYLGTAGIALGKNSVFTVTNAGALTTSNITVTGGSIKLVKQNMTDANDGLYLGTAGIALGKNSVFKVSNAGRVDCADIHITGGSLNATNVTVTNLNAGSISGGTIDARTVTINNLDAAKITSGTLSTDRLSVSGIVKVINGNNNGSTIDGNKITTGTMNADVLNSGTINASVITITNINASNITSGEIDANVITVKNINASKITTGTLSDAAGKFSLNMTTGAISMQDGSFSGAITANSGTIGSGGDWEITTNGIHSKYGPTSAYGDSTTGVYVGKDGFCCNDTGSHVWISGGAISSNGSIYGNNLTAANSLTINGNVTVTDGGSSYFGATGVVSWTDAGGNAHALGIRKGVIVSIV